LAKGTVAKRGWSTGRGQIEDLAVAIVGCDVVVVDGIAGGAVLEIKLPLESSIPRSLS